MQEKYLYISPSLLARSTINNDIISHIENLPAHIKFQEIYFKE